MKALHATADSDSIRAPGGQGPSLNTPHARDAVPKVWTLRLRSEMGRHRLLTASGDIPAHWLRPESPPKESGRAGVSLSLRDWDTRKRSGTALGVLRLASVEPLRVFRGRGARAG